MEVWHIAIAVVIYLWGANFVSYQLVKNNILNKKKWGLNICCGKTDGGGVNADIYKHKSVPNFKLVKDIYKLPFKDKKFKTVLCSHTLEHVDDPKAFFNELQRVGDEVTVLVPPLYDLCAVCNIFEHKWIFLSFKASHKTLPRYIKLPFSHAIQGRVGQINHA